MTDDYDDMIMDETFEHEAPTAALLLDLQARYPQWAGQIADHFMIWLWQDWCDANLPPPPEPTPEEVERFVEQAMQSFWAKLAERDRVKRRLH